MTKEDKQQLGQEAESVLDFKDAKEMTIGQANRKAEEIEAGVKETDNVLDKYIKQHRDEIELTSLIPSSCKRKCWLRQRKQPLWMRRTRFQVKSQ